MHIPTLRCTSAILVFTCLLAAQDPAPRARDLGIPFDGKPGPHNAITDVAGVLVGQVTVIAGEGKKAVRTGVTAIIPNARRSSRRAAFYRHNGDGEVTGTHFIEEKGLLISPILVTNTISVPDVAGALIRWSLKNPDLGPINLPVVAETWDGYLNDIYGFHVKQEHVFSALDGAKNGKVAEGNVGGGTGMICHGYKGGIGTASRLIAGGYTLGVLVQANHGRRKDLRVAGIPVARAIAAATKADKRAPRDERPDEDDGSIIVVVATDAPLMPFQLQRIVRRVAMGLARNGSYSSTQSGDMFLAFTTAATESKDRRTLRADYLKDSHIDSLFAAAVQATEEAIINAMIAAQTMVGKDGHRIERIPHEALRDVLREHKRLR
jgi:L-aminopeptidase/D-esterase-like protein